MKKHLLLVLAALLLCGCDKTETVIPETDMTPLDTTTSETETTDENTTPPSNTPDTRPVETQEIPPWETAQKEEEFIHTWNPAPTLTDQSFQILRFGEKYTDDTGKEGMREDDWIVETRKCYVRMKMPSHWFWDGVCGTETKGDDSFRSLRLSYEKVLYRQREIPSHWLECTTDMGEPYYRWETVSDNIISYHFAYPTRVALVDYWFEAIFYGHPDTITEPTPEEYYDTYIKPMAESVRIETSGGGVPLETGELSCTEYTYTISCLNTACPCTCQVTLSLPNNWQPDEQGVFYDTTRSEASCLKTIRFVPPTSITDATTRQYDFTEKGEKRTTTTGYTYYADIESLGYTNPYTGVTNHTYLFPLDTEKNHVVTIPFSLYPAESDAPDPDDYYETHILPILDSIRFEIKK